MNAGNEKVVFVDFEDAVPWNEVVSTMDTIRSLASDVNHDEIKVALKVKEADQPQVAAGATAWSRRPGLERRGGGVG